MRILSSAIQTFFIISRDNKMTSVELLSYFYVVNIMSGDKSKILEFAKCASRDFTHFFILCVIKNQQSWTNYKCGKKWTKKKANSNIFWSFFFIYIVYWLHVLFYWVVKEKKLMHVHAEYYSLSKYWMAMLL